MSSVTEEKLTDHAYDGIQEYDNPTPGWWVLVFVLSILFSIGYGIYYHVSTTSTSVKQGYDEAVAANLIRQFGKMGTLKQDEPSLLQYMQNKEYVKAGESVFKQRCVSCHGPDAGGLVGPNMTDDYYKNIVRLGDFFKVINNGAAQGTMPPQRDLHPNEVALVAAYLANLRGTNVPGGKAPYGQKIDPWPAAPVVDAAPAPAAK